jgi:iron-sulfur cluster assembly accessory protein
MDAQEFLRALKAEASDLLTKTDELRKDLGLAKLYLIYIDEEEVVWGARYSGDVDEVVIVQGMKKFTQDAVGVDYGSANKRVLVLNNDFDEVVYVVRRALLMRDVQYNGVLEFLDASEVTGQVLLTVEAPYKEGVIHILKHLLPWVKRVDFSNDDIIQVTEKAAKKMKEILAARDIPESGGIRFGLIAGGCSGMQYDIRPEPAASENDEVIEVAYQENSVTVKVRIFINPASLRFLNGAVIDYGPVEHLMGEGFIIKNPNEKGSCGCGKSVDL